MDLVRSMSPVLHLDLNNFNSLEAQESRYVLTSPRSLESCARLEVKPVDLLFKSLTDFIEENQDSSLERVTELYEEYERGRRERLRMCREEREKLIQQDRSIKSSVKPFTALETVPEQTAESQSPKASTLTHPTAGMTQFMADPVQSNPDFSISDGFPSPPAEDKTMCGQKFPYSFSLGDLRCSPATERQIKRLSQEISYKLSITIPEKDCKLAALMLARHEQEEICSQQRTLEEQHREEEQRQEEARRVYLEHQRRKQLLSQIRQWQEDLEARRRRREEEETMLVEHREREMLKREVRWRKLAEEHQGKRRSNQEQVSKEAKERKRYQERLLKEKEHGEEARRERELHVACAREKQALRSKRMQVKKVRRRLEIENQTALLKHILLKKELEEKQRTSKEMKREELEQKLRRSIENHMMLMEARLQELRERASREEEQTRRAQQRAEREDKVQIEQRQTLAQRCQLRTNHAVIHTQVKLHHRAQSARQQNQEKVINHHRLREKVLEEEKSQWEQKCRAVAGKEERREKLHKERVEAQERRRKVAHASCYMRERVREKITRRTFDQMAREAELSAHMERLTL